MSFREKISLFDEIVVEIVLEIIVSKIIHKKNKILYFCKFFKIRCHTLEN